MSSGLNSEVHTSGSETDCSAILAQILGGPPTQRSPSPRRTRNSIDIPALSGLDTSTRFAFQEIIRMHWDTKLLYLAPELLKEGIPALRELCAGLPDAETRLNLLLEARSQPDPNKHDQLLLQFLKKSTSDEIRAITFARRMRLAEHRMEQKARLHEWQLPTVFCPNPACYRRLDVFEQEADFWRDECYNLLGAMKHITSELQGHVLPEVVESFGSTRAVAEENARLERRVNALEQLAVENGLAIGHIPKYVV
ncbi:unnamed protein product [Peniophora sp. CBMAI 1063]|nr:unnamed protein product [Peniophora sp. CBMAI 1063]